MLNFSDSTPMLQLVWSEDFLTIIGKRESTGVEFITNEQKTNQAANVDRGAASGATKP